MTENLKYLVQRPGWDVQSISDPAFAKMGSLLTPPKNLKKGGFAFFGIPFEGLTINPIGGKNGPDGLRKALSKLRPYSPDLDIDFIENNGFADLGDIEVAYMDYDVTLERAESVFSEVLQQGWIPVVAGGSHTITEATLRAFSEAHNKNIGVVWFDAHPDIMHDYKGDKHYCGCPLMRVLETGHIKTGNVASFGLRGFANAAGEIREGREMGLYFYTMDDFYEKGLKQCIREAIDIATDGTEAFYITLDADAIDHTFAPATQYPGPGGFQPYEMMKFIRELAVAGAGAIDVVEYAPLIDYTGNTGSLLGTLLCEFMAGAAWRMQNSSGN